MEITLKIVIIMYKHIHRQRMSLFFQNLVYAVFIIFAFLLVIFLLNK